MESFLLKLLDMALNTSEKIMGDMMLDNIKQNLLWEQYRTTKDTHIREKLIIEYSYLVKYIAGRLSIYFGSNVEHDDLISYGIFGLIDAIEKFDINKGVKFETYASLRIRGAIIDSIRELDWVPRSLRQKSKELERIYQELESELGHSATDFDVAKKMGISIEEFHKFLSNVSISTVISLDEYFEQNFELGIKIPDEKDEDVPEKNALINEIKEILAEAINNLPEREKYVITLYYFEELTLKEISKIMNVSESRISQLHTKAILRMKAKLEMLKKYFS
jgi:RNA polymerase sigma factor for flagellar operon FliA